VNPYEQEYKNMRAELRACREQLLAAEKVVRGIAKRPYTCGAILNTTEDAVTVSCGTALLDCEWPPSVPRDSIGPGTTVAIDAETNAIHHVVGLTPMGATATVTRILSSRHVEVSGDRTVIVPPSLHVRIDDRVVLDFFTKAIIVRNLGRSDTKYIYTDDTKTSWDDIGGQADAKQHLIEAIEEPFRHPDVYRRYGKKPCKGILLYGPPGCGKTSLGKAAATSLAKHHGSDKAGFIYVKGPEILNSFVGESEAGVRRLFQTARAHKEAHGVPAVIFLDEVDALLAKRGGSRALEGMERTIVPQFLSEMDGLDENAALVLLATNLPDTLDAAAVREGRVDRKISVGRPNKDDAIAILRLHLQGRPIALQSDEEFARRAAAIFFSPVNAIAMIRCKSGDDRKFTLGDVASGAALAGVVERATQLAIRRELRGEEPRAVSLEDVQSAIATMTKEEKDVDHESDIETFCEPFKRDVVRVERAA
jgi:proteasome-associated ATPase